MNSEFDEMYRLTALKYMTQIAKKKKVASYQLQETTNEPVLPLEEALIKKRDLEQMDESYNPKKVEQSWGEFWEKGYFFVYIENSSTPITRLLILKNL